MVREEFAKVGVFLFLFMACLKPITIFNPARVMSLDGAQPFRLTVPCGRCSECAKSRRNEWFLRSFYHAKSCIEAGGFMQMVTLTFRDSSLPHLSDFIPEVSKGSSVDFPCFSRHLIRLFMVLLRQTLHELGYNVYGHLDYFIASEYGTDDNATHRPHHHVLFYVTFDIDACVFNEIVGKCWKHGHHDGIGIYPGCKGREHVLYHTFGRKYVNDSIALQKAVFYTSKYVRKSSLFSERVLGRIDQVLHSLGYSKDSDVFREMRSKLFRKVSEFHTQSKGYGFSLLHYQDMPFLLSTGLCKVQDSKSVVSLYRLPMYYKRKLFYDVVKDFRGVRTWKLNDLGKDYKISRYVKQIDYTERLFADWYANLSRLSSPTLDIRHIEARVTELMNGRSWRDFAIYVAFYKDRIKPTKYLFGIPYESDFIDDLDTWLIQLNETNPNEVGWLFSYLSRYDKRAFGSRFLSSHYLGSSVDGYDKDTFIKIYRSVTSIDEFRERCVYNDMCSPDWVDFDEVFDLYCASQAVVADLAEEVNLKIEDLQIKLNHKSL